MSQDFERKQKSAEFLRQRLHGLNLSTRVKNYQDTSRIVARGYAIVNKNDKPLTTIKDITEGEQLTIQMRDGQLEVEVKNVNEKNI